MSDARYLAKGRIGYDGARLWRRNDWTGRYLQLGSLVSNVEQAVAVVDFASRNGIELDSASHSLHTAIERSKLDELEARLGSALTQDDIAMYRFSMEPSDSAQWSFPNWAAPGRWRKIGLGVVIASFSAAKRLRADSAARTVIRRVRALRNP